MSSLSKQLCIAIFGAFLFSLSGCFTETPTEERTISGTLLNEDGTPAANLSVMLLKVPDSLTDVTWLNVDNLPFDTLTTVTDENGNYSFEELEPGSYSVTALNTEGGDTTIVFIPQVPIKSKKVNHGKSTLNGKGKVKVQVVKSGREISNVLCVIPALHLAAISDSNGICEFEIPTGEFQVEFVSDVYDIHSLSITVKDREDKLVKNINVEYQVEFFSMVLESNDSTSSYEPGSAVSVPVETKTAIKAVPGNGVTFVRWQLKEGVAVFDNILDENTNVIILENSKIEAVFRRNVELMVTSIGSGSVTPADPVTLALGSPFEIEASPDSGWVFKGWDVISGSANLTSDSSSNTSVSVFKSAVVRAEFELPKLTVALESHGNGKVSPDTLRVVEAGKDSIHAIPDPGYVFTSWKVVNGDLKIENESSAHTEVTVHENGRIQGSFERASGSITVEHLGNGTTKPSGAVSSILDREMEVLALPDSGWSFSKWTVISGSASFADSLSAKTKVTASTNAVVRAVFNEFAVNLKLSTVGTGTVSPASDTSVKPDSLITITATPDPDWKFVRWVVKEGAAFITNISDSQTTVRLTRASEIQAQFIRRPVTLSMQLVGKGSLSPSADTIVGRNQQVILKAVPDSGWEFHSWQFVSGTGAIEDVKSDSTMAALSSDGVIRGIFKILDYDITIVKEGKGTTTLDSIQSLEGGVVHAISAAPDTGWEFAGWEIVSGSGTLDNDSGIHSGIQLHSDLTLKAKFSPGTGLLTVGKTGEGSTNLNDTQTVQLVTPLDITATPASTWSFVNWVLKSGEAEFEDAFSSSTKLTLKSAAEIEAVFSKSTTILTVSSFGNGTTVPSASANVEVGVNTPIRANPSPGWKFAKWVITSGNASIEDTLKALTNITMISAASIQAVFVDNRANLTINVEGSGSTSPHLNAVIEKGIPFDISAIPEPKWRFVNWVVDSGGAAFDEFDNANTAVTISGDARIKAVFSQSNVTLTVNGGEGGNVSPDQPQSVTPGTEVDINAVPIAGAVFHRWVVVNGQSTISDPNSASTKVTVNGNSTIRANFRYQMVMVQSGQGSINPSGIINRPPGSVVPVSAQAAPGWFFEKWSIDTGDVVIEDSVKPNTNITLNSPATVRAVFKEHPVTLSLVKDGEGSFNPTGDTQVVKNQQVPIEAFPSQGWKFIKWESVSGQPIISDVNASFTYVTLDTNSIVKGIFVKVDTVNVSSNDGGTTTPSGIVYPTRGDTLQLEATVLPGNIFSHWTSQTGKVDIADSTQASTMAIVNGNDVITAVFYSITSLELTVTGGSGGAGNAPGTVSPTGVQTLNTGDSITIQATPNAKHEFVKWNVVTGNPTIENPNIDSTTVIVSDSTVIAAEFKSIAILTTSKSGGGTVTPVADTVSLGDTVQLNATPNNNSQVFWEWTVEYGQADISDLKSPTATVVLLSDSVHVKGTFKKKTR